VWVDIGLLPLIFSKVVTATVNSESNLVIGLNINNNIIGSR
jgi:hypothetical protein